MLLGAIAGRTLMGADMPPPSAPPSPPGYTSASLALLDPPDQPAPAPVTSNNTAGPFDRWTLVSSGETPGFFGARWIGNQFVALGQRAIMTSPDGITWRNPGASLSGTFYDIATNGNIFVAVGDKGGLATSPDLKTWTSQTSPTSGRIYGVYWFNNQFFATGDGLVYTSAMGSAWSTQSFGGSYFHHGTLAGNNLVIADSDGVSITNGFSRRHISNPDRMMDVAFNNSLLVAVGSAPNPLWTSADGSSWQKSTPGSPESLGAVTWTGSQFVAGGGNSTILNSPDGNMWSVRSLGSKSNIYAVAGHGDTVVAVTATGEIYTNQNIAAVAKPEITFAPGAAGSVPQLELQCATADAKIFYTEDGKDPIPHSIPYAGPFSPAQSETIKVRSYKDGLAPSAVSSADFIIPSPVEHK